MQDAFEAVAAAALQRRVHAAAIQVQLKLVVQARRRPDLNPRVAA